MNATKELTERAREYLPDPPAHEAPVGGMGIAIPATEGGVR
jgi:hypothetical protein